MADEFGEEPEPQVHHAARTGDIDGLAAALAAGADLDERWDRYRKHGPFYNQLTPLMVAAGSEDGASAETVEWLLGHGADPAARSARQSSPAS